MGVDSGSAKEDFESRVKELYIYVDQLVHRYMIVQSDCLDTPWGALTHQEEKVIKVLAQQGPCIMRQIAEHLGLAMSTATGIVDRLVQKGLVDRERSEEDRRIVQVKLTDGGHKVFEIEKQKYMDFCRYMLTSLTREEQATLLDLIRKSIQVEE